MKKLKAFLISVMFMCMLTAIILGLYLLKVGIWMWLAGLMVLAGLYFTGTCFYHWLLDDGPIEVDIEPVEVSRHEVA